MGPAAEAQAAKKLAQILGNMCDYDEAEQTFLQAIAAEEVAYASAPLQTFPTRLERAQFNFDIGRYDRAVLYYEKALPIGSQLLEQRDPRGLALLLDDYAAALANTGNSSAALEATAKASSLRSKAAGPGAGVAKSKADYVPYPKSCKGS
jgi:tetratricopeptide (TPR) repeat protein